jgi:hypothetical protein
MGISDAALHCSSDPTNQQPFALEFGTIQAQKHPLGYCTAVVQLGASHM